MSPGCVIVTCLHDFFDLTCPVCGCRLWDMDGQDIKCQRCAVEIHVIEDAANCRMVLEVQGG